jgi:hypothetical protein
MYGGFFMPNGNISAVQQAFARRAQQGGGQPSGGSAPVQNPANGMAQARSQGTTNGQGGAESESMFILKVLAKRLEALPPHKPEKQPAQPSQTI